MATGAKIVTFERGRGNTGSKQGKVRIPDAADHFHVDYENLYDFMRENGIKL